MCSIVSLSAIFDLVIKHLLHDFRIGPPADVNEHHSGVAIGRNGQVILYWFSVNWKFAFGALTSEV
jgi:hypothetical protein